MNDESKGLLLKDLERALDEARSRALEIGRKIEDLQRSQRAVKEEEELLMRLISLRKGKVATPPSSAGEVALYRAEKGRSRAATRARHPVVESVISILREAEHPLHISELMRLATDRAIEIPGAGSQANLISYLRRDPAIVRPSRGVYGLAEWGIEEMTYRKKRPRRFKTKTRASQESTHKERKV